MDLIQYRVCTKCKIKKTTGEFSKGVSPEGTDAWCKLCRKIQKQYLWNKRKNDKVCLRCGKMRTDDFVVCQSCRQKGGEYRKSPHVKNKAKIRSKIYREDLKIDAFKAYGGEFCACCGDDNIEFLSIDHIGGGGAEHRRELRGKNRGGSGLAVYIWLRNNNYPKGFRVLCMNCNFAFGQRGYCPHDRKLKLIMGGE